MVTNRMKRLERENRCSLKFILRPGFKPKFASLTTISVHSFGGVRDSAFKQSGFSREGD